MQTIPRVDAEFKTLIPPLAEEERRQLEENILTGKKCRDAIVLWNGVIVDGHNRYEICTQHGIEFEVTEVDFASREEAKLWILENQLSRRNLTDAARIELALTKVGMLQERARRNLSRAGGDKKSAGSPLAKSSTLPDEKINTRKVAAAIADTSERTLQNYQQLKASANPQLLAKVQNGNLKIGTAHRMLPKQIIKQLKHAGKMHAFIAQNMPIPNNPEATQDIQGRLQGLSKQLQAIIEKFEPPAEPPIKERTHTC